MEAQDILKRGTDAAIEGVHVDQQITQLITRRPQIGVGGEQVKSDRLFSAQASA